MDLAAGPDPALPAIVRGIFLKGDDVMDLWRQYAILAAVAVGALSLAIWRFRKTLTRGFTHPSPWAARP
jgi:hypothetical protein